MDEPNLDYSSWTLPKPSKPNPFPRAFELHYGGCFVEEPTKCTYVGGQNCLFTIEPEKMTWLNLTELISSISGKTTYTMEYILPGLSLKGGREPLNEDGLELMLHLYNSEDQVIPIYLSCSSEEVLMAHCTPDGKVTVVREGGGLATPNPVPKQHLRNIMEAEVEAWTSILEEEDECVIIENEEVPPPANLNEVPPMDQEDENVTVDVDSQVPQADSTDEDIYVPAEAQGCMFSDDESDTDYLEDGDSDSESTDLEAELPSEEEPEIQRRERGDAEFQQADEEAQIFWNECDSDEDFVDQRPVFDGSCGYTDVNFVLGQRFTNAKVFRLALMAYAAEKKFEYLFVRNEKHKLSLVCMVKNYRFRLYASRSSSIGYLGIKYLFPTHDCAKLRTNRCVNSKCLHIRFMEYIRGHPGVTRTQLVHEIERELKLTMSKPQAYNSIRKANNIIYGDLAKQFKRIHDYCETLVHTNPGSRCTVVTKYDTNRVLRFQRLYIRFAAQLQGFIAGCRPFLQMDGCHLKGHYGGQLLAAIGYDANEQLYPLCFAVVEIENKETWKWFLGELFADLGPQRDRGLVFMSDKQKGLVQAIYELGNVEHRWCMKHMVENFGQKYKGDGLKEKLWKLSWCTTIQQFNEQHEELRVESPAAAGWVTARPPQEWAKAHYSSRAKTSIQVNNLAESFNAWILEARALPIIPMIEKIRIQLMQMFYERRTALDNYHQPICPKIMGIIETNKESSADCYGKPSGNGEYEVDHFANRYVVKLKEWTCSCREWHLSGIPCPHVVCAILKENKVPEAYVHKYYKVSTYKSIYKYQVFPVGSYREWVVSSRNPPEPPIVRKAPDRPKKKRIRSASEGGNPYKARREIGMPKCSSCKQSGHNKRTCPKLRPVSASEERRHKEKMYMRRKRAEMAEGGASTSTAAPTKKRKAPQDETPATGPELARIEKSRNAALARLKSRRQRTTEAETEPEPEPESEPENGVPRTQSPAGEDGIGLAQEELNAQRAANPPQMETFQASRFGDTLHVRHNRGGRNRGGRSREGRSRGGRSRGGGRDGQLEPR